MATQRFDCRGTSPCRSPSIRKGRRIRHPGRADVSTDSSCSNGIPVRVHLLRWMAGVPGEAIAFRHKHQKASCQGRNQKHGPPAKRQLWTLNVFESHTIIHSLGYFPCWSLVDLGQQHGFGHACIFSLVCFATSHAKALHRHAVSCCACVLRHAWFDSGIPR
jgi:hypothetical protein